MSTRSILERLRALEGLRGASLAAVMADGSRRLLAATDAVLLARDQPEDARMFEDGDGRLSELLNGLLADVGGDGDDVRGGDLR